MPSWFFALGLACAGRVLPAPQAPPGSTEAPLGAPPSPPVAEELPPPASEALALEALDASVAALRQEQLRLNPTRAEDVAPLLANMVAIDRRLRLAADSVPDPAWGLEARLSWVNAVEGRIRMADQAHGAVLGRLLDLHGWFDTDRFGDVADQDGWILAQHAVDDPALQARVLELLGEAVTRGQSAPARYAYLYDRVQVLAGAPQRYGTQGRCVEGGGWEPLPLEDAARVNRLRAEVGLGTLDATRAQVAQLCR